MNPESPTGRRRAADGEGWTRSSYSADNGHCVEIHRAPHAVEVRDSKHTTGATLSFPRERWLRFLHTL